jgi:hypothetical protein
MNQYGDNVLNSNGMRSTISQGIGSLFGMFSSNNH